jgi:hypothetical protein
MHHLLLDAGFTASLVVAIITGATLVIGFVALLAMKAHTPPLMFSLLFLLMWASFFLATGRRDLSVAWLAVLAQWFGLARERGGSNGSSRRLWAGPEGLPAVAIDSQAIKDR